MFQKLEGSFLEQDEFQEIKLALQTLQLCISFFQKFGESYPTLKALLGLLLDLDLKLLREIDQVLDEKGKLRSNASKELQLIRTQLLYEESRLRKVMELEENVELTEVLRDGKVGFDLGEGEV